jgi:tetratricopeptide (TPR) repeat protein
MIGCLSENQLLSLLGGGVSGVDLEAAEGHLDQCRDCRALLAKAAGHPVASAPTLPNVPGATTAPAQLGRYRVDREVGSGGMGTVYAAHDPELGRVVAVKLLRATGPSGAGSAFRARLAREAQAMARMAHPNVITIYDIGTHDDHPFIAMELVDGGTLTSWLQERPRSWREVTEVMLAAGRGLAAAHAAGVVHRDFKPDNVLVGADGRVRVTDFGLAQLAEEPPETSAASGPIDSGRTPTLTRTGAVLGTPAYMPPEQIDGTSAGERSDVFSYCATLYKALYGELPFEGRELEQLRDAALAGRIRVVPAGHEVPERLHAVIVRGLAGNPAARWSSMNELLGAIDGVLRPQPGHRRVAVVTGGVLALALALLALGVAALGHSQVLPRAGGARRSILVLDLENRTGNRQNAWLSTALAEVLGAELTAGEQLHAVPRDRLAQLGMKSDGHFEKDIGADLVLAGRYAETGGKLALELRLIDARSGRTLSHLEESGAADAMFDVAARAGARLRRELGVADLSPDDARASRGAWPSNPEAARYYAEGLVRLRQGDPKAAHDSLEKAISIEPDFALAHSKLANVAYQMSDGRLARDEAGRALELSKDLSRELRLAIEAQNHEANRRWDKAAELYRALVTFFPDNVEYGLRLTVVQVEGNKPKEALATVETLRLLPPPASLDPRISLNEAFACYRSGDAKHMLAAARDAAAKASAMGARAAYGRARRFEADALISLGDRAGATAAVDDAIAALEETQDRIGLRASLTTKATIALRAKDFAVAGAMFQRVLELNRADGNRGGEAGTLSNLALVYKRQRELAKAAEMTAQAVAALRELGDKDALATALANLADDQARLGEPAQAIKTGEEAIALARSISDDRSLSYAMGNLGLVLLDIGEPKRARATFEDAFRQLEKNGDKQHLPGTLVNIALVLRAQGDLAGARRKLEAAMRMDQQNGDDGSLEKMLLAELLADEGRWSDAGAQLAPLVEHLQGDDAVEANQFNVRILLERGRVKEARELADRVAQAQRDEKDWSIRLPRSILFARVQAATGAVDDARAGVQAVIAETHTKGLVHLELEAALALAEIDHAAGRGKAELAEVERRARKQGLGLIARQAAHQLH